MEQNGASRTAIGTAVHRAAHLLLDEDPKILVDPFARAFAGYASDAAMLHALASTETIEFPRMRTVFTLRSRYVEDELAAAIIRGIDQYIILGAGLDSFAYRRPDLVASLDVFEVDHPASQAWKRARVAELGIAVPTHLHHVSIDFERQTLGQGLADSIVDFGKPVFLSLLGVTQYLTPDATLRTLRDVAATTAPGSELSSSSWCPPRRSQETRQHWSQHSPNVTEQPGSHGSVISTRRRWSVIFLLRALAGSCISAQRKRRSVTCEAAATGCPCRPIFI